MTEDIVALANEAQPHLDAINAYITRTNESHCSTSDEHFAYLDHVAAFRAIRDRAPACNVRDTWDQVLATLDTKLQPRFED